ncbi:hypothetical protein [Spiroplasma sp. BIUS-1]|uniref:hypothetical protein n=1 Tax=Spiroplasma sp. BIUS-1 TaxID=216964 RepID=UPI0013981329|nr:hypothetical protein [Spiroplasma sp. BIUS-1]QHX36981.1 hypothetical protein SBIUS_v1c07280 [Spiroplasma sp. BIUS-1]
MNSFKNKKIVKNLYVLFIATYLIILFSLFLFEKNNKNLFTAVQVFAIINTIVVTSLCLWIIIESGVMISKLRKNFNEIKNFNWFLKGDFLKGFFKLIVITAPIFISTELKAFDYIWKDERTMINLEALLIFSLTSVILFSVIILSLNLVLDRFKEVVRLDISEKIFFTVSKMTNQDSIETNIIDYSIMFVEEDKHDLKEFIEKNSFIQHVINWKKSLNLKSFKKGVTPPHLIF